MQLPLSKTVLEYRSHMFLWLPTFLEQAECVIPSMVSQKCQGVNTQVQLSPMKNGKLVIKCISFPALQQGNSKASSALFLIGSVCISSHRFTDTDTHIDKDIYRMCVCAQSCSTLCDPKDCSPLGSSVHGIFQAQSLGWVASFYSRGIFPTQGLNLHLQHLLHWQANSLPLHDLGSPVYIHIYVYIYIQFIYRIRRDKKYISLRSRSRIILLSGLL